MRESLFAWLGDLSGTRVLDLYAGTGALGIEALSRGAVLAVFAERSPRVRSVLRANLEALGLEDRARVQSGDALRAIRQLGSAGERFDLVLLDPPYAAGAVEAALTGVVAAGIASREAAVVVEHGRRHPVPAIRGLAPRGERRYGDTVLTWLAPAEGAGEGGGEDA